MMEESESGQNFVKNQVKVVGEREILASLVEFKHHSMAETIRNEKEEKKTKAEAPGLTKVMRGNLIRSSLNDNPTHLRQLPGLTISLSIQ